MVVDQQEDNPLDNKVVQLALRQILGSFTSVDLNFRALFDTLSNGMSLGMLVSCTAGNFQDLNKINILSRSLPHILELCKIVAYEMNEIIHDDNIDQVTILASNTLETLMKTQQEMSN